MSPSEIRQAEKLAATGLSEREAQAILADTRSYTAVEVLAAKIAEEALAAELAIEAEQEARHEGYAPGLTGLRLDNPKGAR